MTQKRRFLDLWIVESNTVYQEVPYEVVCDWVQQGRLLEDDRYRPSGTREWLRLGGSKELAVFLPKPEPFRAEDPAEAMEPVETGTGFTWKRSAEAEDDDVDMIPLIDVSLVLLIFFMLTASAAALTPVPTPEAEHVQAADVSKEGLRIDININNEGQPVYRVRIGDRPVKEDDDDIEDFNLMLERVRAKLPKEGQIDLIINAHKDIKARFVRDVLLALRASDIAPRVRSTSYGVSERPS
jgi:biopolymer transport protein ExbD